MSCLRDSGILSEMHGNGAAAGSSATMREVEDDRKPAAKDTSIKNKKASDDKKRPLGTISTNAPARVSSPKSVVDKRIKSPKVYSITIRKIWSSLQRMNYQNFKKVISSGTYTASVVLFRESQAEIIVFDVSNFFENRRYSKISTDWQRQSISSKVTLLGSSFSTRYFYVNGSKSWSHL